MLEWMHTKLTENPNWSITFGVIGILIVFAVVATLESIKRFKQGDTLEQAISQGIAKGFFDVSKGFDSFYRLLFKVLLYIGGPLLILGFVLWIFGI